MNTFNRMALVDHGFHRKTRSTFFLDGILEKMGNVTRIWDDSWSGGRGVDWCELGPENWDLVFLFQVEPPEDWVFPSERVVHVLMYDAVASRPPSWWRNLKGRVLAFSHAVAYRSGLVGLDVLHASYAPDVQPLSGNLRETPPGLFWWRRREEPALGDLVRMVGHWPMSRVTVWDRPDPGVPPLPPPGSGLPWPVVWIKAAWQEERRDYLDTMKRHAFFLAPRWTEGLGQAFLEAMALGRVVLAHDRPTMNEMIRHGEHGLLLDFSHPSPVGLPEKGFLLGQGAHQALAKAGRIWAGFEDRLREWLTGGGNPERSDRTPDAACLVFRARFLWETGQKREACEQMEQVLAGEGCAEVQTEALVLLAHTGSRDNAWMLDRAQRLLGEPGDLVPSLQLRLADLHRQLGDAPGAERLLGGVVARTDETCGAAVDAAFRLMENSSDGEGRRHWGEEVLRRLDARNLAEGGRDQYLRASVLERLGQREEALSLWDGIWRGGWGSDLQGGAAWHLSVLYRPTDPHLARVWAERTLEKIPDHRAAAAYVQTG